MYVAPGWRRTRWGKSAERAGADLIHRGGDRRAGGVGQREAARVDAADRLRERDLHDASRVDAAGARRDSGRSGGGVGRGRAVERDDPLRTIIGTGGAPSTTAGSPAATRPSHRPPSTHGSSTKWCWCRPCCPGTSGHHRLDRLVVDRRADRDRAGGALRDLDRVAVDRLRGARMRQRRRRLSRRNESSKSRRCRSVLELRQPARVRRRVDHPSLLRRSAARRASVTMFSGAA